MREVQVMLDQTLSRFVFVGTVGSVTADGVNIFRDGATQSDGVNYFALGTGYGLGDRVLAVKVGKGAAVLGIVGKHPPVTFVTSTPYTVLDSDFIVVVNSASAVVVNLPTTVGRHRREFHIKRVGAGLVTITPTAPQLIDGAATKAISSQYTSYHIVAEDFNVSGGSNAWHII